MSWPMLTLFILSLIKQGFLVFSQVMPVLERYKTIPHTPENENSLRGELLDLAKRSLPTNDPRILEQLARDGVSLEELM